MKKIIITLCLLLAMNASVAQTINRNGNNFVAESAKTSKSAGQAIGTKYTYTDTDGSESRRAADAYAAILEGFTDIDTYRETYGYLQSK